MTYNVFGGTLNFAHSQSQFDEYRHCINGLQRHVKCCDLSTHYVTNYRYVMLTLVISLI